MSAPSLNSVNGHLPSPVQQLGTFFHSDLKCIWNMLNFKRNPSIPGSVGYISHVYWAYDYLVPSGFSGYIWLDTNIVLKKKKVLIYFLVCVLVQCNSVSAGLPINQSWNLTLVNSLCSYVAGVASAGPGDQMRDDLPWLDVPRRYHFQTLCTGFQASDWSCVSYLPPSCASSSVVPGRVNLRLADTNTTCSLHERERKRSDPKK